MLYIIYNSSKGMYRGSVVSNGVSIATGRINLDHDGSYVIRDQLTDVGLHNLRKEGLVRIVELTGQDASDVISGKKKPEEVIPDLKVRFKLHNVNGQIFNQKYQAELAALTAKPQPVKPAVKAVSKQPEPVVVPLPVELPLGAPKAQPVVQKAPEPVVEPVVEVAPVVEPVVEVAPVVAAAPVAIPEEAPEFHPEDPVEPEETVVSVTEPVYEEPSLFEAAPMEEPEPLEMPAEEPKPLEMPEEAPPGPEKKEKKSKKGKGRPKKNAAEIPDMI